ncbi:MULTISPECIES: NusG domain II-containing protein [Oceanotoga]|jgi:hypothetical protein|uniref:NusG domain-containing protein n=1 Tax=Oceanotoga teriensis TaxID=515440 RepID=A0AA45C6W7_9BACT|nr:MULTISPECIES: NusG domain II-containing protein [Oceanotoga]MDN5342599.1 hypothetical protein [Oceanotoga sp.]MDO7976466.1 NusG domain II-containing protein [Oceanotoga teriensis]PWJ93290.1 hypothetical protein C7380_108120 [Oceanotoga teriensis]
MKKSDITIIILIVLTAIVFIAYQKLNSQKEGKLIAEIYVADELFGTYELTDEEQKILIDTIYGTNILIIHNKTIEMYESDCDNQLCVHMGAKSKNGEMIVCLPNKVFVEIKTK